MMAVYWGGFLVGFTLAFVIEGVVFLIKRMP